MEQVRLPDSVAELLRAKRRAALAAEAELHEAVSLVLATLGYANCQITLDFDAGTVTVLDGS